MDQQYSAKPWAPVEKATWESLHFCSLFLTAAQQMLTRHDSEETTLRHVTCVATPAEPCGRVTLARPFLSNPATEQGSQIHTVLPCGTGEVKPQVAVSLPLQPAGKTTPASLRWGYSASNCSLIHSQDCKLQSSFLGGQESNKSTHREGTFSDAQHKANRNSGSADTCSGIVLPVRNMMGHYRNLKLLSLILTTASLKPSTTLNYINSIFTIGSRQQSCLLSDIKITKEIIYCS